MKIHFHPEAVEKLFEAISYYEEYQEGLGLEFAKEIYSTIERIISFPEAWSRMSENTRSV